MAVIASILQVRFTPLTKHSVLFSPTGTFRTGTFCKNNEYQVYKFHPSVTCIRSYQFLPVGYYLRQYWKFRERFEKNSSFFGRKNACHGYFVDKKESHRDFGINFEGPSSSVLSMFGFV